MPKDLDITEKTTTHHHVTQILNALHNEGLSTTQIHTVLVLAEATVKTCMLNEYEEYLDDT